MRLDHHGGHRPTQEPGDQPDLRPGWSTGIWQFSISLTPWGHGEAVRESCRTYFLPFLLRATLQPAADNAMAKGTQMRGSAMGTLPPSVHLLSIWIKKKLLP